MDLKFLEFEQPIAELEAKIEELRFVGDDSEININEEVARLQCQERVADQEHLRQTESVADCAGRPASDAAVHAGLPRNDLARLSGIAWRSHVRG